jgi:Domain of unknown function (DUF4190)
MSGTDPTKSTGAIQTAIPLENQHSTAPSSSGFRRTSGLATASMVCGIVHIVSLFYYGMIVGLIAIILGIVAHKKIQQNRPELIGECQATAGIITGSIGTVGSISLIIFVLYVGQ